MLATTPVPLLGNHTHMKTAMKLISAALMVGVGIYIIGDKPIGSVAAFAAAALVLAFWRDGKK